jgi:uncharacterized membrane protein YkoI
MTLSKRLYMIAGLVAVMALAVAAVTMVSGNSSAQTNPPTSAATGADTVVPCTETADSTNDTEAGDSADTDNVQEQCGDQNDSEANDNGADEPNADNNDGQADSETNDDNGGPADAGNLDDGKDLLPQAGITIEQAITAAKTAATGDIGEIDLEDYNGKLVFNVDLGDQDVKVDASNGTVLGSGSD